MIKPFAESPLTEGQRKYRDFLASAEWQATRTLVIARDGWKCQICGRDEDLSVHHYSYKADWLLSTNLVTVCRCCHEILTRAVKEAGRMHYIWNRLPYEWPYFIQGSETMAQTLFELYTSSVAGGGEPINISNIQTVKPIAKIVAKTLDGQVHGPIRYSDCSYKSRLDELVREYRAQACRHYLEEGFSPAEIQRFLGLNDAQMAKVMRNARKEEVTAGG